MKRLLLALLAAVLLQFIPILNLPFLWFTAFFHELGHALVTLATGGTVRQLVLAANGAGHTLSSGGWPVLIGLSGYPAASLAGGLLWQGARAGQAWRWLSPLLLVTILSVLVFWVRDVLSGVLLAVFVAGFAALWRLGAKGRGVWALLAATLLVNALLSPLQLLLGTGGDGHLLYQLTAIPATIFVIFWVFIGLSTVVWVVTRR